MYTAIFVPYKSTFSNGLVCVLRAGVAFVYVLFCVAFKTERLNEKAVAIACALANCFACLLTCYSANICSAHRNNRMSVCVACVCLYATNASISVRPYVTLILVSMLTS